jgi:outer membrane lipoprotein-sorting protein
VSALRRISTRRLLAICAITVVAAIGVAAVATAMTGGGPKPPPKPLANAVQDALNAPDLPGISARIEFTNHLVDASSIQGTDPLLAGASGRLWASPDGGGKLRLELQSEAGGGGDTQVLVSENHFQIYDGSSETVYQGTLPEEDGKDPGAQEHGVPALGQIEAKIGEVEEHAELSGATPSDVAGQPTYTLHVAPKHDGGLLGGAEVAWDADNGTPLRAAIYSSASSSPVLQLEATDVSFEAVPASTFEISPPAGAKVVDLNPSAESAGQHPQPTSKTGVDAVQKGLGFTLVAPSSLAGLPQGEVRSIEIDGKTAALATYGKGLGGIAVLESASEPGAEEPGSSDEGGLSLPKVSINGAQGEELDTALGTVLRFSRGGVDYVVIGSVPPAAAEAAARAL